MVGLVDDSEPPRRLKKINTVFENFDIYDFLIYSNIVSLPKCSFSFSLVIQK